jgi:hypothetical protein
VIISLQSLLLLPVGFPLLLVASLLLSLIQTLVLALRNHLNNPGQSYLRDLIVFAKIPLQIKSTGRLWG